MKPISRISSEFEKLKDFLICLEIEVEDLKGFNPMKLKHIYPWEKFEKLNKRYVAYLKLIDNWIKDPEYSLYESQVRNFRRSLFRAEGLLFTLRLATGYKLF